MERQFILIGGAPTTGKSTIATQLAQHLKLPWISTDQLRTIVKPYGNKEKFPTLYDTQGITAEEFLTKYTPQEISDMEFEQGNDVWPAVEGLIQSQTDWNKGGVIEGVNILPHLIAENNFKNKHLVKPVFLVDLNEDRMRKVVYTRGLYDDAKSYSDSVKEQEVEWAMIFAKRLQQEAHKFNYPCIDISKTSDDISKVIKLID